jgi:molybdopterin converting factor small subunit
VQINIQYFAKLREERGCSTETIETNSANVLALFNELQEQYRFSMDHENLKVAINDEFCGWQTILKENDTVVFIQPVAGG